MGALSLKHIEGWPLPSGPLGEARNIDDGGGQFVSFLGNNSLLPRSNNQWPRYEDISKLEKLNSFRMEMISDLAN